MKKEESEEGPDCPASPSSEWVSISVCTKETEIRLEHAGTFGQGWLLCLKVAVNCLIRVWFQATP